MCESAKCLEQAKSNEAIKEKEYKAKQLAEEKGEWYGLYRSIETGEIEIAPARLSFPFFAVFSPKLSDT